MRRQPHASPFFDKKTHEALLYRDQIYVQCTTCVVEWLYLIGDGHYSKLGLQFSKVNFHKVGGGQILYKMTSRRSTYFAIRHDLPFGTFTPRHVCRPAPEIRRCEARTAATEIKKPALRRSKLPGLPSDSSPLVTIFRKVPKYFS